MIIILGQSLFFHQKIAKCCWCSKGVTCAAWFDKNAHWLSQFFPYLVGDLKLSEKCTNFNIIPKLGWKITVMLTTLWTKYLFSGVPNMFYTQAAPEWRAAAEASVWISTAWGVKLSCLGWYMVIGSIMEPQGGTWHSQYRNINWTQNRMGVTQNHQNISKPNNWMICQEKNMVAKCCAAA